VRPFFSHSLDFNNEGFESRRYDAALRNYEKAAIKTWTSLAFLNAGQNLIFSVALTTVMVMASHVFSLWLILGCYFWPSYCGGCGYG
jgi:ABC-type transport system involved in Fe-S cluster assembly fused permease/ATPase subunit